jgi:hypothetical protein
VLVTAVPLNLAAEKLKGFVADHHAEIVDIEENRIVLQIKSTRLLQVRRVTDRPVCFALSLTFNETHLDDRGVADPQMKRTMIDVAIRPKRQRDRRQTDYVDRARQLLLSLKSYLMAHELTGATACESQALTNNGVFRGASELFAPWM